MVNRETRLSSVSMWRRAQKTEDKNWFLGFCALRPEPSDRGTRQRVAQRSLIEFVRKFELSGSCAHARTDCELS
jgi:hypothetical protein